MKKEGEKKERVECIPGRSKGGLNDAGEQGAAGDTVSPWDQVVLPKSFAEQPGIDNGFDICLEKQADIGIMLPCQVPGDGWMDEGSLECL